VGPYTGLVYRQRAAVAEHYQAGQEGVESFTPSRKRVDLLEHRDEVLRVLAHSVLSVAAPV